jgi:hypothetical protein
LLHLLTCCSHLPPSLSFLSGSASLTLSSSTLALRQSLYRGIVDLSHLKNKEMDELENALDFMTTPNTRPSQQPQRATVEEESSGAAEASSSTAAAAPSDVLTRVLPQKDPNVFDIVTLRSVAVARCERREHRALALA